MHREVQLLHYRVPEVKVDPETRFLARTGFNHVCVRVEDLDTTLEKLRSHGVEIRSEVMQFHDRRLVYTVGPEGVTIELAQRLTTPA